MIKGKTQSDSVALVGEMEGTRMINEPGDRQWSSYRVTVGKQDNFEGSAAGAILLQFGKQPNRAIERFRESISQGRKQEIWCDLKNQIYPGDKKVAEKYIKVLCPPGR